MPQRVAWPRQRPRARGWLPDLGCVPRRVASPRQRPRARPPCSLCDRRRGYGLKGYGLSPACSWSRLEAPRSPWPPALSRRAPRARDSTSCRRGRARCRKGRAQRGARHGCERYARRCVRQRVRRPPLTASQTSSSPMARSAAMRRGYLRAPPHEAVESSPQNWRSGCQGAAVARRSARTTALGSRPL